MEQKTKISYTLFVGIDISKTVYDVTILSVEGKKLGYKKFKNNEFGNESLIDWVKSFYSDGDIIFCLEHTGIYSRPLFMFLQNKGFNVCIESGFKIKRSGGIIKGKNDKLDSYRIADYALSHKHKLEISEMHNTEIFLLHDLLSTRKRLVECEKKLITPINELKTMGQMDSYEAELEICKPAIDSIKKAIKKLDKEIDKIVEKNEGWKENFDLATSVKGVGRMISLWMIVYTKNFKSNINARQFASLAGIAPFSESSGSSVHKGNHVSHHSHKFLKGILHAGVMSAIKNCARTKAYHVKKKEEGKKGFVVMNNIKNKLVQTVFAVVKSKIAFDSNFIHKKAA